MILPTLLALAVQGAAPAAAAAAAEKPVCRREQALGSFLAKRTCHSRAEWSVIDRANQRDAETALSQRRPGMPKRD
jgi:hypothetical protein